MMLQGLVAPFEADAITCQKYVPFGVFVVATEVVEVVPEVNTGVVNEPFGFVDVECESSNRYMIVLVPFVTAFHDICGTPALVVAVPLSGNNGVGAARVVVAVVVHV